jgi:hypothetical protein
VPEKRAPEQEDIDMTAKKITYTATAEIDGVTVTDTRTSHRPYTHAAFRKGASHNTTKPAYFATFHSSAELAARKNEYGEAVAVVEVTEPTGSFTVEESIAMGEAQPVEAPKAPAKRTRKAAKPQVDPALAEIVAFVLGGAHTARTDNSRMVLTEAADLLKAGKVEDARKTLYPIRTRVALAAIKKIKAL